MAAPSTGVIPSANAAEYAAAVTPSDFVNFSSATRGLYVGGAGNVVVVMASDGAAVTFTGVPAGTFLPVRAIRVNNASTTATSIVALW
jgi:hypothetical protein